MSGRPVDDLKCLIGLDEVFYVGDHGLEWLAPDGAKNRCAVGPYCGDDFTDEVAFHRFDKEGITILVAETPRPTAASYYLRSPNELHEFLRLLAHVKATAH
jgi:trehalose-6-phosphatase